MGPAAWAAIGRAMALALVSSTFGGKNSIVTIVAKEVCKAIKENELDMAEAMLRDMAYRHKKSFNKFLKKYKEELPKELLSEFLK